MAFKQFRIESNYGDIINISSVSSSDVLVKIGETEEQPLSPSQDIIETEGILHYDLGIAQPSSILHIPLDLPVCRYNMMEYLPNYTDPKIPEYYASETYTAIKEECDNKSYWVWGNYDDGGMVVLRTASNNYQITIHEGFYKRTINDIDYYFYKQNYRDFTSDIIQNLSITCNTSNDVLDWTYRGTNDVHVLVPVKNVVGVIAYYEALDSYDHIVNYSWGIASQFFGETKQTIGDDMPSYGWQNSPTLMNVQDGNFPGDAEHISGNMWGNASIDEDGNPFINGGTSGEGGGWGSYPFGTDNIGFTNPEAFTVDVVSSGILTLYKPTAQQMSDFQQFLFSGITDSISNQLKKLTSDPLQYLLFIAMVHYDPVGNTGDEIRYAGIGTGVYSTKIDKQYKQLDCGTIIIPEATNSFLDYGSFSKVSIYLPYIGVETLNIDDVMGATIHVVYNINQLDGSCIAQVKCTRNKRSSGDISFDSVLYHFNGNCFTTIPIFASDWRGSISSALSLIGGVGSIATGNVGGGIGAIASSVAQEKVSLKRSGSPSSSYGYMDNQKPYLILERPIQNIPLDYGKYEGYTSNINYTLNTLKGYTEVDTEDILIDNFDGITSSEFEELKSILEGGIYL